MLGTEFSFFYLQQGLKLQLNQQLASYLQTYNKSYPDLNPCCITLDPVQAIDMSEKIPGIFHPSTFAMIKVMLSQYSSRLLEGPHWVLVLFH